MYPFFNSLCFLSSRSSFSIASLIDAYGLRSYGAFFVWSFVLFSFGRMNVLGCVTSASNPTFLFMFSFLNKFSLIEPVVSLRHLTVDYLLLGRIMSWYLCTKCLGRWSVGSHMSSFLSYPYHLTRYYVPIVVRRLAISRSTKYVFGCSLSYFTDSLSFVGVASPRVGLFPLLQ